MLAAEFLHRVVELPERHHGTEVEVQGAHVPRGADYRDTLGTQAPGQPSTTASMSGASAALSISQRSSRRSVVIAVPPADTQSVGAARPSGKRN